jgi:hypothetical protein
MQRKVTRILALSLCTGVSACGSETVDEQELLIGPNRSYEEAVSIAKTLRVDVLEIAETEHSTRLSEMPVSGTAQYRGVINGRAEEGFPIDYVADLALEMEFDAGDVSGKVSNFVTDGLPSLTHPNGEIDLEGSISWDRRTDQAYADFNGSGPLEWPGQVAIVTVDAGGTFTGDEAQAIIGGNATEFRWTGGFLTDTTSQTYGEVSAIVTE